MDTLRSSFILPIHRRNRPSFKNQPLGSLYLLTVLEQEFKDKIEPSLIDLRGLSTDNFIFHIPERDIYFYSVSTIESPEVQDMVRKIREVYPRAKHVAGG